MDAAATTNNIDGTSFVVVGKTGRTTYMNQEQFDLTFQFQPPSPKFATSSRERLQLLDEYCGCFFSPRRFIRFLLSFLPILEWLPAYDMKANLLGDMMAGLTVGIVQVPQGIAYAILTGVPPVYGLYTSFFGVICYMLFGTSKHVSVGPFAIISLMTGVSCRNILDAIDSDYLQSEIRYLDSGGGDGSGDGEADHRLLNMDLVNLRNFTSITPRMDIDYRELVQGITLLVGLIQIVMGMLKVEFLANYLSDQLVSGFCTGAAVHVVVVQLNKLLQLPSNNKGSGPGYLIRHLHQFILNINQTNLTALAISIAGFAFLYIGKDIINQSRVRKRLPTPIPFELLLVVGATALSAVIGFESKYAVKVVNTVPLGFPVATLPRLELFPYILGEALEIAFVVVAMHLSMCKLFSRQMSSRTDNNMELYALGLMEAVSSLFCCFPISSSIGRSMLNVECGAKTQLSAAFTAALLLVVILFMGPLLSALPVSVLAVIIIFSMKSVFKKMPHELAHLWHVSKIDFLIWVVAFGATVVLNVMQGLAISVGFALLTTVFRIQWPRWRLLSRLNDTEDYRDCGRYKYSTDVESVRVLRFDGPLLYQNVEHFANSVREAVSSHCSKLKRKSTPCSDAPTIEDSCVDHLIVDCSGFTFVDYSSINALIDLFHQLKQNEIHVYFAGAKAPVRDMLELCNFYVHVPKEHFYPTIHDAMLAAIDKKRLIVRKRGVSAEPIEDGRLEEGRLLQTTTNVTSAPPPKIIGANLRDAMTSMTGIASAFGGSCGRLGLVWGGSFNTSRTLDELDDV